MIGLMPDARRTTFTAHMRLRSIRKTSCVILLFVVVAFFEQLSSHEWVRHRVLPFDPNGYYLYLPATFIYHDLGRLEFYPALDSQYRFANGMPWYAIYDQPQTGRRLNKYPVGVAFASAPFFLIGHLVASFSRDYPPDGWSVPYQFCISMSAIVLLALGMHFAGRSLRRLFGDATAAIALLLFAFGTNLFAYSWTGAGMGHQVVFMQYAAFMWCFLRWRESYRPRYLWWMGLLLGWILITRPIDVAIALIPLFHLLALVRRQGVAALRVALPVKALLPAVALFCIMAAPQFLYWKWVTGHFVYFSYEGEGFHFSHPHLLDGLFSYYRGWLVYTPLALPAIAGLVFMQRQERTLAVSIGVFLALMIYLVFSWYYWSYGWSFSCRALIEVLAVLLLPMGALGHRIRNARRPALRAVAGVAFAAMIGLNVFQSHQFAWNMLPDGVNRAYYWRIFGKTSASDADKALLRPRQFRYP